MSLFTLIVGERGDYTMLKILLATSTILIATSSLVQASAPTIDNSVVISASGQSLDQDTMGLELFADRGRGGNSGRGGGDNSGHDDDNDHDNDDNDDDNDDDNGETDDSGCDSAHDIAEHANCRT
jgi:hypothetical protein